MILYFQAINALAPRGLLEKIAALTLMNVRILILAKMEQHAQI